MKAEDIYKSPRLAGQLERYHTWPTLRRQTNADHSWHVARIYLQLFGTASSEVLVFIMFHDAGEIRSGDLPYPVKKDHPEVKRAFDMIEEQALIEMGAPIIKLPPDEKRKIKLCDLLEMWEFGKQEMAMGNKLAYPICERTSENIFKICREIDSEGDHTLTTTKVFTHMKEFTCTME